jgi:hypothetical protein
MGINLGQGVFEIICYINEYKGKFMLAYQTYMPIEYLQKFVARGYSSS